MWRSRAIFAALALVGLTVLGAEACTQGDPCLRHSDCPDEQKCAQGACVFGSRDGDEDTGTPTDGANDGDEAGETTTADTATPADGGLDTLDDGSLDASDTEDAARLDASETDASATDSASLDASETAPDTSTDTTTTDADAGG